MMNVGWQVYNDDRWIAGLSYYRNLLAALLSLPNRRISPILLGAADGLPTIFSSCRALPYPPEKSISGGRIGTLMRRVVATVARRFADGTARARYLKCHAIRLLFLSHGELLGKHSPVPVLCWIPDFQHRRLPGFFSKEEISARNVDFLYKARHAQGLLFSSEEARKDFNEFFPGYGDKAYVLRFVASPIPGNPETDFTAMAKYGIGEPFFLIPNQLWIHKNHAVVRDALSILKSRSTAPLVICTGYTTDYRDPGYFAEFMKNVGEIGLSDRMRFLGLIPYGDVAALMRRCVAVINPSLFEGWSTAVEEGKSLGKRILLSDIPVHREQAPKRGAYFIPREAERLAILMSEALDEYDPELEVAEMSNAEAELPSRMMQYGRGYEDIVSRMVHQALSSAS